MSSMTALVGNLVGPVEIRFTQSGKAVGSLTIAVSDRRKTDSGDWEDGNTWFARCTLWGELAENAAASLDKGMRVVAWGRLGQRDWEDKDGNKRSSVEVTVDSIGPDLRYATAVVSRVASQRPQGGRGGANSASWGSDTGSTVSTPEIGDSSNWSTAPIGEEVPF